MWHDTSPYPTCSCSWKWKYNIYSEYNNRLLPTHLKPIDQLIFLTIFPDAQKPFHVVCWGKGSTQWLGKCWCGLRVYCPTNAISASAICFLTIISWGTRFVGLFCVSFDSHMEWPLLWQLTARFSAVMVWICCRWCTLDTVSVDRSHGEFLRVPGWCPRSRILVLRNKTCPIR